MGPFLTIILRTLFCLSYNPHQPGAMDLGRVAKTTGMRCPFLGTMYSSFWHPMPLVPQPPYSHVLCAATLCTNPHK